ncbi:MAG TPA: SUMF1/EgtB/PvdO family nonheme iron enzyme, partial [Polyangiaceae bacterium]|nr:SUMF1/EgtB/PvdO family nonheme iron enzyme [Polyangiaceae bacterium]
PPAEWQSGTFLGSTATALGDVDGDGKADAVAFDGASTWVMLSTGTSFGPSTEWQSATFAGSVTTALADVNADGKADGVAFDGATTSVMLSSGTCFGPPTEWQGGAFVGSVTTALGDVNGDGAADAIAFDGSRTWAMLSQCLGGDTLCAGNTPQTCSASGQWQPGAACAGATPYCVAGVCGAEPASCAPGGAGRTSCGTGSASCCASLAVAGGGYDRTFDPVAADGGVDVADDGGAEGLADPATVSNFRLDQYEVTVGRFRGFVAAWTAGWRPKAGSGKHAHLNGGQGLVNSGAAAGDGGVAYETGWDAVDWDAELAPNSANLAACTNPTWTPKPAAQESLPVNCVTWPEAYAFCIWDGGFLPSEAEWAYAAAGGAAEREYPWGATDPGTASQYGIYGCDHGPAACNTAASLAPVGTATLGAGAWGQLDLAGNVGEWTLDWSAPYADPCSDCAYLTPATYRVDRGGAYYSPRSGVLSSYRGSATPTGRFDIVGFRCARTP